MYEPRYKVVIFASGRGSNAGAIVDYFKERKDVDIVLIVSNNEKPGVFQIAKEHGIPEYFLNDVNDWNKYGLLLDLNPDLIVLAGYLKKIPIELIKKFEGKIVNIHPALLPKFGGKGMYGRHVHELVVKNKEKKSGMTIHMVNEEYDKGKIIAQYECDVESEDTAESLAQKVLQLEHKYYPKVIDKILKQKL